jgi:hypothetical protein
MATTTGGTTYVTSTDLVANYPTASLALANRVDIVASGGPGLVKTSGYTITVADILAGNKFLYNSASPGTFTLPTSSLVDGMVINVAQIGAGALTVSGGTIVGTTVTTAQYQSLMFVYVASGTTWYSVAPPSTVPGLSLVTPTSIANSGGSASLSGSTVTFTGVNSVSLNGIFTSTYENYRVLIRLTAASANNQPVVRMRAAGTDATSAYFYGGTSVNASGSSPVQVGSNVSGWGTGAVAASYAEYSEFAWEFYAPQIAAAGRRMTMLGTTHDGSQQYWISTGGVWASSTVCDGFSFVAASGTVSGVIRAYGYRN